METKDLRKLFEAACRTGGELEPEAKIFFEALIERIEELETSFDHHQHPTSVITGFDTDKPRKVSR